MKLTGSDVVNEWYVKYEGTNVNFTKMQETVANVAGSAINFSLGLPAGAATVTYGDNSSTNIDMTGVTFGAITKKPPTPRSWERWTAPVVSCRSPAPS